jgi:hypothetical protein
MRICAFLIAALLMTTPALAADVDGTWTGSISTPNGDVAINHEFKADGAMLTGFTVGPDGTRIPIKDGKVDGNKISFMVTFDFGGMMIDIAYTGVVSPAEIALTADFAGMPFQYVVKKAG